MSKIKNNVELKNLEILGVDAKISKLLMSNIEGDFLLGWELVKDHPNCEYIRAYCKGSTNVIRGLEDYFDEVALKYYDAREHKYIFGDIIIKR